MVGFYALWGAYFLWVFVAGYRLLAWYQGHCGLIYFFEALLLACLFALLGTHECGCRVLPLIDPGGDVPRSSYV